VLSLGPLAWHRLREPQQAYLALLDHNEYKLGEGSYLRMPTILYQVNQGERIGVQFISSCSMKKNNASEFHDMVQLLL
jgi:hypothetical protein